MKDIKIAIYENWKEDNKEKVIKSYQKHKSDTFDETIYKMLFKQKKTCVILLSLCDNNIELLIYRIAKFLYSETREKIIQNFLDDYYKGYYD